MPRFVGMKPNALAVCDASGNLVAGCVILYLNGRFGADGSVYFGPIGISDDPALLRAITEAIRESARRHHAVSVACWPNVAYRLYSSDGQPDGEPNDALLTGFTDAGWTTEFTNGIKEANDSVFEFYNTDTCHIYQKMYRLHPGYYKVTLYGFYRAGEADVAALARREGEEQQNAKVYAETESANYSKPFAFVLRMRTERQIHSDRYRAAGQSLPQLGTGVQLRHQRPERRPYGHESGIL